MSRNDIPAGIDWATSTLDWKPNPALWDAIIMKSVVLPELERVFDLARGLFRCLGCGDRTYNPERCRDCDIEHLITSGSCRECGVWIVREDIAGPMPSQHKPECTLRLDRDPFPRPL